MANNPPKHPSAANMGMCVRTYKDGVCTSYHDIEVRGPGGCGWLVVCGLSVGVSCVTTFMAIRIDPASGMSGINHDTRVR